MKYEYIDGWDPYIGMDSMSSGIKAFQLYTGLRASGNFYHLIIYSLKTF